MPLWTVYHSPGVFSDADKAALAEAITDIYGRVMPRFYVGIVYREVAPQDMYIGGKPAGRFVRFVMEHIAREFPNLEASRRFIDRVNQVIAPYVAERGCDWELHIDETPFDLWSINGHYPPRGGTPDEARWISENRASARTHG
ncbi:tautomerase family protein [Sandaracinobacteroides hominis]|uniref:tautomerase family protein n=1 Tax=Sandaracinobacteroides hominis TaxID=2780086 RepID=UPI0018F34359|nr:tautomerase family protein [Sandaracinobacteroides hominis]